MPARAAAALRGLGLGVSPLSGRGNFSRPAPTAAGLRREGGAGGPLLPPGSPQRPAAPGGQPGAGRERRNCPEVVWGSVKFESLRVGDFEVWSSNCVGVIPKKLKKNA